MYYTYILENEFGKRYIGQTNNLEKRLKRHNAGGVKSTKGKGPWEIIFSKEFATRKESVNYETYLKSLENSNYIKEYIIRSQLAA
jgi:putative endonuclease